MPTVTVVPSDSLIIVDGKALVFPFDAPTNLHALQWRGDTGHTEWTDGPNQPLTAEDYDEQVAPFITRWQDRKGPSGTGCRRGRGGPSGRIQQRGSPLRAPALRA